ncbi:hypothetical protein BG004_007595 [Podila humilis]|nr:hypothetical protein BG004_007595 [Podila humilis]
MANHHASTYHDVKNVPMIVSPLFKVPTPISPPYDMHPLPDDITQRRYHDFALEHKVVAAYQRMVAEESAAIEAKENAYKVYSEERQARLKKERISRARKIAPGFLDNEDRRILTPTLATAQVVHPQRNGASSSSSSSSNNNNNNNNNNNSIIIKTSNQFDYSEFEANDGSNSDPLQPKTTNKSQADEPPPGQNSDLQQGVQEQPRDSPTRELTVSPNQDDSLEASMDGEEEVIVQAVPLSKLTGMLRDSCLEDDSAINPRPWTGHDAASEKSTLPTYNTRLDYREFEQGLGPPDPWETPVDDMAALKDVISQQMGHSGIGSTAHSNQQDVPSQNAGIVRTYAQKLPASMQSHQTQPQQQQQQQQQPYPYHSMQTSSQQYQTTEPSMKQGQQFMFGSNNMSRSSQGSGSGPVTGTGQQGNSSPIPVPAYVDQKQQQQGHASIPQHPNHPNHPNQQQHRNSTGGIGAHPSTGLSTSQLHARFGNASPSPPPLPPQPRSMTASPSGSGMGSMPLSGVSRPPLPARPGRPTDVDSQPISSSVPDHVTMSVTERSMTPPRPPLPPPPHPTLSTTATTTTGPPALAGLRPMLKPKPTTEYGSGMGLGLSAGGFSNGGIGRGGGGGATTIADMDRSLSGSSMGGSEDMQQHAAQLAPPDAEELIDQVASAGFSRERSREVLEKYDYDTTKALNHLLDWG